MPSLKDFRTRIASVKSTRKITSAMKMVAAAKLRRAQAQAAAARPYAERMERMLGALAGEMNDSPTAPKLLSGAGQDKTRLFIVTTADRGLCGAFNSSIVRESRRLILAARNAGQRFKIICVGRKARDQLRRQFGDHIIETVEGVAKPSLEFSAADKIARRVLKAFEDGEFDSCVIVYNRFQSAISQIVTVQQLIPFAASEATPEAIEDDGQDAASRLGGAIYEFEPDEERILAQLLPRNLGVQIYRALLENQASEHGARMTAMDNATRNAGEMIDDLTMQYNRSRQAAITKELLEIIGGAEAL